MAKGLETFLPSLDKISTDRSRVTKVPLFRGYVFVRIGTKGEQHTVIETPGIVRILGAQRIIEPIPDVQIESVRILLRAPVAIEGCPFMNVGDRVKVTHGPLTGCEGLLLRKKNALRLVLSVDLLGASVSTEVCVTDVVVIGRDDQSPVSLPARSGQTSRLG